MGKKAVIFEARFVGHTIGFAAEFAAAFAARNYDTVLVLNGASKDRPELAEAFGEAPAFEIGWAEAFQTDFASAEHGAQELAQIAKITDRYQPDRVVVPTGDGIGRAMSETGSGLEAARALERALPEMDIVVHHVAAAYPPKGRASFRRWRRGLRTLSALKRHRLLTCDAYVGIGTGRLWTKPSGARLDYVPHLLAKRSPWDAKSARAHFDLPADRRILVSVGDVAKRKGIDRLIAAADRPDWPEEVMLFLAGPVSDELRGELARIQTEKPDRIRLIDRFLTNEEFAAAPLAADIVWAVTPGNLGVSSTYLYAALQGRSAIIADTHLSAVWMKDRIGPAVATDLAPEPICKAVRAALALPAQTADQKAFLAEITDPEGHANAVTGA